MPIRFKSSALRSSKQTKVKSYIHRVASIDIHISIFFNNTANVLVAIITRKHCVSIATIFPIFRSQPYGVAIHPQQQKLVILVTTAYTIVYIRPSII